MQLVGLGEVTANKVEVAVNYQFKHNLYCFHIRPIFGLTQLPSGFLRFPQAFKIWLNDAVYRSSGES